MTRSHDTVPRLKLCERCFAPIEHGEEFVSLGHLVRASSDGSLQWRYAHVHTTLCAGQTHGDQVREPCGSCGQAEA